MGPGQLLSKLVRSHPAISKRHAVLSSCPNPQQPIPEACFALSTLGRLWLAGQPVNWKGAYAGEEPARVTLPGLSLRETAILDRGQGKAEKAASAPPPPQKLALEDWGVTPIDGESLPLRQIRAGHRQSSGPRNALEERIVELWRQVLGAEEVDIRESFLELGGNSLMAVQLISRVRDVFEVDLPVGEFLRSPTVMAMAEAVALRPGSVRRSPRRREPCFPKLKPWKSMKPVFNRQ